MSKEDTRRDSRQVGRSTGITTLTGEQVEMLGRRVFMGGSCFEMRNEQPGAAGIPRGKDSLTERSDGPSEAEHLATSAFVGQRGKTLGQHVFFR